MQDTDGSPGPEMEQALVEALLEQQHHVGIGVCDREGVLTAMSPVLKASLGAAYSPTHESSWVSSYHLHDEHGEPLPSGQDPLALALHGAPVTNQDVSVRRPGGSVRWLLCSGLQLHNKHELLGAAVLVIDVTDRAEQRRRLDQLRDRLVETVSHEVRTPLATIRGHLELLENVGSPFPRPVQWSLGAIRRASVRLEEVVVTISDLADQSQREDHDRLTGG